MVRSSTLVWLIVFVIRGDVCVGDGAYDTRLFGPVTGTAPSWRRARARGTPTRCCWRHCPKTHSCTTCTFATNVTLYMWVVEGVPLAHGAAWCWRGLVCLQTYVGNALVSVNPCRALPLYSAELVRAYLARPPYQLPPHLSVLDILPRRNVHYWLSSLTRSRLQVRDHGNGVPVGARQEREPVHSDYRWVTLGITIILSW